MAARGPRHCCSVADPSAGLGCGTGADLQTASASHPRVAPDVSPRGTRLCPRSGNMARRGCCWAAWSKRAVTCRLPCRCWNRPRSGSSGRATSLEKPQLWFTLGTSLGGARTRVGSRWSPSAWAELPGGGGVVELMVVAALAQVLLAGLGSDSAVRSRCSTRSLRVQMARAGRPQSSGFAPVSCCPWASPKRPGSAGGGPAHRAR